MSKTAQPPLCQHPTLLKADVADMDIWREAIKRVNRKWHRLHCDAYQQALRRVLRNLELIP